MRKFDHYVINKDFTMVLIVVEDLMFFTWDYVRKDGKWHLADNNENM